MSWNGCDVASTARAFHGSKLTIPSFARKCTNQKLVYHIDCVSWIHFYHELLCLLWQITEELKWRILLALHTNTPARVQILHSFSWLCIHSGVWCGPSRYQYHSWCDIGWCHRFSGVVMKAALWSWSRHFNATGASTEGSAWHTCSYWELQRFYTIWRQIFEEHSFRGLAFPMFSQK